MEIVNGNQINKRYTYLGLTLLYYDVNFGIGRRKTFVTKFSNLSTAEKTFNQYGVKENISYVGIQDIFQVGGILKVGQYLGRHTWYYANSNSKSNQLFNKIKEKFKVAKGFNIVELFYIYKDGKNSFCLSILTIVDGYFLNEKRIHQYANSNLLKKRIKKNSLDVNDLDKLSFFGVIKAAPVGSLWNRKILLEDQSAEISKKQILAMRMASSKIKEKIKKLSGY